MHSKSILEQLYIIHYFKCVNDFTAFEILTVKMLISYRTLNIFKTKKSCKKGQANRYENQHRQSKKHLLGKTVQ